MPTVKTLSEHTTILVTNSNKSINGNDSGNLAYSAIGRRDYVLKDTTDYTATEDDEVIDVSSASGQIVQLPACSTTRVGKVYTIRKVLDNSAAVAFVGAGADLINGLALVVLARQYDFMTIQNTGTAWIIIAESGWFNRLLFVGLNSESWANDNAENSLIQTGVGLTTLPPQFFQIGTIVRVYAQGIVSNTGTPTLTIKIKLGAEVLSVAITTASGLSSTRWWLNGLMVCRTVGATGAFSLSGEISIGANQYPIYTAGPYTLDTTNSLAVDVTAQWGTSHASNVFTVTDLTLNVER